VDAEESGAQKRYGALLWTESATLDDAIDKVRAFHDLNDAVDFVRPSCTRGQRWAVVDLNDLTVVATGHLRGR
jgi:hypothetical protein